MRSIAERYFWIVTVIFVALGSYLCARLTSGMIALKLWQPPAAESKIVKAEKPREEARQNLGDYKIIVARNLFNKSPISINPDSPPVDATKPAPPPPPPPPEPLNANLVATAILSQGKSFAMIEKDNEVNIRYVGDEISTGAVLAQIFRDKVIINFNNEKRELLLFDGKVEKAGAPPPPERTRGGIRSRQPNVNQQPVTQPGDQSGGYQPPTPTATLDTIKKVGETSWVVDKREVDNAMTNLSQLVTQVRVVPNLTADGQADGFKIFAIKPNSLFAQLGLVNGDIIKEVNGTPINGIDQAYGALSGLKNQSSIQINIIRNNHPQSMSYDIR